MCKSCLDQLLFHDLTNNFVVIAIAHVWVHIRVMGEDERDASCLQYLEPKLFNGTNLSRLRKFGYFYDGSLQL